MGDHLIPPVPPPADPALLAAANRALAEQVAALEAEVARLRAIIAAERGCAPTALEAMEAADAAAGVSDAG